MATVQKGTWTAVVFIVGEFDNVGVVIDNVVTVVGVVVVVVPITVDVEEFVPDNVVAIASMDVVVMVVGCWDVIVSVSVIDVLVSVDVEVVDGDVVVEVVILGGHNRSIGVSHVHLPPFWPQFGDLEMS